VEITEVYSYDDPNAEDVIVKVAQYAGPARALGLPFWVFAEKRNPIGMVVFGREPIQLLAPAGTLMSFILVADPKLTREKIKEFASEALDFVKRTAAQYALAAFPHKRKEAIEEFEALGFEEIDDCYEMTYKITEPFKISDEIQFEKVGKEEILKFIQLAKKFLTNSFDTMQKRTLEFTSELPREFLDAYSKIEEFYFVNKGEQTVGVLNFNAKSGRIGNVSVDPAHRGKGYTEQALKFALNKLLESNIKQAYLRVHVKNEASKKLCEKIGFIPETRVKTLMWKRPETS